MVSRKLCEAGNYENKYMLVCMLMLMYCTLDTTYAPTSMLLMEGSQPMIMVLSNVTPKCFFHIFGPIVRPLHPADQLTS